MTAMYTVSIPEFQTGNQFYPILKICTASIIMRHINFERDCLPQNRVSSMFRNAAARAKISDPIVPHNLGSQEVLNYWSKLIKADFQNQLQVSKIESVANETGNQQQLCNMLLDLTKEVRESRKEINEMRTSFNAVVLENASHKATISAMGSEMNDMKHRPTDRGEKGRTITHPSTTTKEKFTCNGLTTPSSCILPTLLTAY